jgi:hypothetical protein
LYNFVEELAKYGLTPETYEKLLLDCTNKVNKVSDLDWVEICLKYNLNFNPDTIRKGTQPPLIGSVFVSEYYKWKESQSNHDDKDDEYLEKLRLEKQEIRKEKQKLFDERTGLNKLLREQSRREELFNIVKRAIDEYEPIAFDYSQSPVFDGDSDLIIHVTDVHCGVDISSLLNVFNFRYQRYIQFTKCVCYFRRGFDSRTYTY